LHESADDLLTRNNMMIQESKAHFAACLHAGEHEVLTRNNICKERFAQQISGLQMLSGLRELRKQRSNPWYHQQGAICAANQRIANIVRIAGAAKAAEQSVVSCQKRDSYS